MSISNYHLSRMATVLAIALALCGEANAFDGEESLSSMRSMRYNGPVPELAGMDPARQIDLAAPADAGDYNTAYSNRQGCVIYFYVMGKAAHDVAFNWSGAPCKGKPVSGKGELVVQYKLDSQQGTVTHVRQFKGNFSGGYLSGQGRKTNLAFDAQGNPKEEITEFQGEFAYGMLNGPGKRIGYFPAAAQPSLKVTTGNFHKGEVVGGVFVVSMLHPYPGADAVSQQVVFSDKDDGYYTYQQHMNGGKEVFGKIWFTGSDEAWDTSILSLAGDYQLKGAALQRKRDGKPQALAYCEEWQTDSRNWRCDGEKSDKYFMAINLPQNKIGYGISSTSPFMLDLGLLSKVNPFRFPADGASAQAGQTIGVLAWFQDGNKPANSICNASMTLCQRKELRETGPDGGEWRLIRDKIEWKNDEWHELEGMTATADSRGNVIQIDSKCREFSESMCSEGEVFWENGVTWRGGFKQMLLGAYPVPEGRGRVTFADGSWAEGTKHDGKWVSLSRCGAHNRIVDCSLDGQTVNFEGR